MALINSKYVADILDNNQDDDINNNKNKYYNYSLRYFEDYLDNHSKDIILILLFIIAILYPLVFFTNY